MSANLFRINNPVLEARHTSSGLNFCFDSATLPFAEYVVKQREMLSHVHALRPPSEQKKAIDGNAPFELKPAPGSASRQGKPYRRGILLTHGLSDSPYFMRHLAAYFQDQGFRVMAVLLPGHGTQPGDLLGVTWREWASTVAYGADQLAAEADEIYLAGFSAGGALSVYHSLQDERICGLFLYSPAFRISPKAAWAGLHSLYSWLVPAERWVSILPDVDIYKYESFPKNAAAQMYALTQELNEQELLHKLNLPVFAAASADDTTTDTSATLNFMMHMPHPSSKLVLYSTDAGQHVHGFPEEKLELINSVLPGQRILSFAHTSIVLPPEDAHYGAAGDYSNCTHYYSGQREKYDACINRQQEVLQGEITAQNLAVGTLRRLMYNPHFAKLKDSMSRFIATLP